MEAHRSRKLLAATTRFRADYIFSTNAVLRNTERRPTDLAVARVSVLKEAHNGQDDGGDLEIALGFGDLYVSAGDHVGHFYESRGEWKDIVLGFLPAGLEVGHKCVYVINPGSERDELVEALVDRGVNVESRHDAGELEKFPAVLDDRFEIPVAERLTVFLGYRGPAAAGLFEHRSPT